MSHVPLRSSYYLNGQVSGAIVVSRTLTGGPVTTNVSDRMAEYYTAESAAIVARVYASDFAHLRYSTDLSEAR